jgi:hypothetical protein
MANEIIRDSTNFINASFESWKQITESNIASAKTWFAPPLAAGDWAEVGRASLSLAHGWTDLSKRIIDESLQPCVVAFSPNGYIAAAKELTEISATALEKLSRSQVEAMNGYLDELAQFAASLQKVKAVDDFFTTQVDFVIQLQQQAKASALANVQILNSARSALAAWSEKSLQKPAAEAEMPKPKKTPDKEQKAA